MVPSLGRASLLAPSPLFVWDFNTKATKNAKKKKYYYFQIVIRATTFVAFVAFVGFVLKSKGRARQMAGRERRGSKAVAFGAVKTRFGSGRTQWPQAGEEIAASVNFNAGWYKTGSGAVVRSTPRRDGPSGSRAEPWPSFLAKLSVGRRLALLSAAGLPEADEIDRLQQHGWETAFAGDVAEYVAGEWE